MKNTNGTILRPLPRRFRQAWLIVHVVSSVGWLGVELAALALCLTGLAATDPATVHAMFTAASVLAETMLLPAAILVAVSGLVLSLGTKWGLFRYYWVVVKLAIGGALFVASAFTLEAALATATDLTARGAPLGGEGVSLAGMMAVIAILALTATVVSIVKPWGRINRRRTAAPARATRTTTAAANSAANSAATARETTP